MDAFNCMSFSKEHAELTLEAVRSHIKALESKMARVKYTQLAKWYEYYEKVQELKLIESWFVDMIGDFG